MSIIDKIGDQERVRIDKCFVLAMAPKSSDSETAAAIKSAQRIVSKHGINLYDYYVAAREGRVPISENSGLADKLSTITHLENELEKTRNDLSLAKAKIKELQETISTVPIIDNVPVVVDEPATDAPKPEDGHYTYLEFYSALLSHLGTPKRAMSIYSEITGINSGKIQSWRRAGKVPTEAFDAIKTLDHRKMVLSNHQTLTGDHKRRIDRLTVEGKKESEIVEIMNLEFSDRVFNVNMIKGAKTQIRAAFLSDIKFDGKDRDEARKLFLARYPGTRSIENLLDKVYGK